MVFTPSIQWWYILTYFLAVISVFVLLYVYVLFHMRIYCPYKYRLENTYIKPPRRLKVMNFSLATFCGIYLLTWIVLALYQAFIYKRLNDIIILSVCAVVIFIHSVYEIFNSMNMLAKG